MQFQFCRALVFGCLFGVTAALGQDVADDVKPEDHASKIEDDKSRVEDVELQIRAVVQTYVEAFNAGDVEKLVSLWSPDGVYLSESGDEQIVGRDALQEEFNAVLAGEARPVMAVEVESIEFISPNVALERGFATVSHSEREAHQSHYKVVYVKQDHRWLIDRVTEQQRDPEQDSHYEQLKNLEWIVGEWVDQGDQFRIEIISDWTTNRNYISRTYKLFDEGEITSSGLQIIGWDAKQKQIRSWLFDSDGGFVSGTWYQREGSWIVQSLGTLADGATGSSVSIFRPLDDGRYSWKKINRVVDGNVLPNIDEVIVQRK